MNRKQRRAAAKLSKKNDISDQLEMFQNLPDRCTTCRDVFDKNNNEMAMTWHVVVNNAVNLYCPDCWSKDQAAIKE